MFAPQILGILNITTDSFSDGGRYAKPAAALAHAKALVAEGADIIDVGAASSHPDAADVSAAEEITRLEGVWKGLQKLGVPLSVDSFQPEVQRWALKNGAQWLNDVNGFPHPEIYKELADSDARLIIMHAVHVKGVAQTETKATATDTPEEFFKNIMEFFNMRLQALVQAGVKAERCVLDPGMGFFLSDNPEISVGVLRNIDTIRNQFGIETLAGVSRKSFLQTLAGVDADECDNVTLAAEFYAVCRGVDYIRTHKPHPLKQALPLCHALRGIGRDNEQEAKK